jgi:hypothetical protein
LQFICGDRSRHQEAPSTVSANVALLSSEYADGLYYVPSTMRCSIFLTLLECPNVTALTIFSLVLCQPDGMTNCKVNQATLLFLHRIYGINEEPHFIAAQSGLGSQCLYYQVVFSQTCKPVSPAVVKSQNFGHTSFHTYSIQSQICYKQYYATRGLLYIPRQFVYATLDHEIGVG